MSVDMDSADDFLSFISIAFPETKVQTLYYKYGKTETEALMQIENWIEKS